MNVDENTNKRERPCFISPTNSAFFKTWHFQNRFLGRKRGKKEKSLFWVSYKTALHEKLLTR